MEGWGINLLWRDIVRPAILVGKYRLYPRIPAFRHGEYVKEGLEEIKTYIKRTCILELSIEEITGKEGLELQKLRHK